MSSGVSQKALSPLTTASGRACNRPLCPWWLAQTRAGALNTLRHSILQGKNVGKAREESKEEEDNLPLLSLMKARRISEA